MRCNQRKPFHFCSYNFTRSPLISSTHHFHPPAYGFCYINEQNIPCENMFKHVFRLHKSVAQILCMWRWWKRNEQKRNECSEIWFVIHKLEKKKGLQLFLSVFGSPASLSNSYLLFFFFALLFAFLLLIRRFMFLFFLLA